jgi:hypothetical protein
MVRKESDIEEATHVSNFVTAEEAAQLEAFLQKKLNPQMVVQRRQRADECAEIHIGDECLGVVQKIVDEGETSYSFEITILDIDLEEA